MTLQEYLIEIKKLQQNQTSSYQLQFENLLQHLRNNNYVIFPSQLKKPLGRWSTEEDIQKLSRKKITTTEAVLYLSKSGLIAVDIDDVNMFCDKYDVTIEKIKEIATVQTGRGYHIYIQNDSSLTINNDIKEDCFDFKSKLIVIAGSRLYNEKLNRNVEYKVLNPFVYKLSELPDWLQNVVNSALQKTKISERINKKDYVYSNSINDQEIEEIIEIIKESYTGGEIDGWTVEAGLSSYLVKVNKSDDEIHKIFEYIYEFDYDRSRTQYIIDATRSKQVGVFREFFNFLKSKGINIFSPREKKQKQEKKNTSDIIDEIVESSKDIIYRSKDMKHFYLLYDGKVTVLNKDEAKLWLLKIANEKLCIIPKESTLKVALTKLQEAEICYNPKSNFGYNKETKKLNAFKRTYFINAYLTTEKTIKTIESIKDEISYENISNPVLQDYIKNIFYSDDDFRAFISFLVLKLAGEKAGYILLFATNQGAGKSNVLTELLRKAFNSDYVCEINYSQLHNSNFNGEFENKYLIILEEMHIKDNNKNDKHIYESLKRDSRAKKILINKKNVNPYETDFFADFIGYTNNPTPVVLSEKDDTRLILIKNFESRRLSEIQKAHSFRTFDNFYAEIEKAFTDYILHVVNKIDTIAAREFLENYVDEQNSTVKRELMLHTNRIYTLVEEYKNIEEHFVREPDIDELRSVNAVKSGIATLKDISIVVRLMGADSLSKNHRVISDELEKLAVAERRTEKYRFKLFDKNLAELQTKELHELYEKSRILKFTELAQYSVQKQAFSESVSYL